MENVTQFNRIFSFGLDKTGVVGGSDRQRQCFGFTKNGGGRTAANTGQQIASKQVEQIWLNRLTTVNSVYKPNATQKAFLMQNATAANALGARARSVLWALTGIHIDPVFEELSLNLDGNSADRSENWTPKPITREERLMIQPNPANDYVDITLNGLDLLQIKTIRIQSITGIVVKEIVPDTHNFSVSTENFPSGIYFVQIVDHFGSYLASKKVIISH